MKVADLHCDLLSYLLEPGRSAEDPAARASIGQMRQGGVVLQVFAAFTITHAESAKKGERQVELFREFPAKYGKAYTEEIFPLLSIENASSFCDEYESLDKGLKRLEKWHKAGPIAYISFTWNDENRFGGGNASEVGIKPDGETLLKWMDGKGIAIDLSHTSDALAEEILNTIDQYGLRITPIASHSNFRSIMNHPRNLTDPIALEIIKRKGLIGINFMRLFLGTAGPEDFIRQVEHAQKLGAMNSLCLGADFFYDGDMPPELDYLKPFYHKGYENSSCYPRLLHLLHPHLSKNETEKLSHKNVLRFLKPLLPRTLTDLI